MARFLIALGFLCSAAFADYSPFARYELKDSSNRTPLVVMLNSSAPRRTVAAAINTALGQSGPGVRVPLEALILEPRGSDQIAITLVANRGNLFPLQPVSRTQVEAGSPVAIHYSANEHFRQVPGGLTAVGSSDATLRFFPDTGDITVVGLHGQVNIRYGFISVTDSGSTGPMRGVRSSR